MPVLQFMIGQVIKPLTITCSILDFCNEYTNAEHGKVENFQLQTIILSLHQSTQNLNNPPQNAWTD